MADKVRVAIVGTGGIAQAHLNAYRVLADAGYDQFEIVAVCDKSEERRNAYAALVREKFSTDPVHYASVEDMCQKATDIQAADICTPHAFHHTCAIPCLNAGIDVMDGNKR